MPLSRSSRLALSRLHGLQAVTTLLQLVRPPRDLGTTWSKVSSLVAKSPPQYWQLKWSRRKTLNRVRSEEHTSELQSQFHLVCRLLLEKKKKKKNNHHKLL